MSVSIHRGTWLFAAVAALFLVGCEPQKETTIEDLEEATQETSEQKEEAKEAEAELQKTKSEFEQTQQRDDYVQAKEKELVEVDMQLQQLKDKTNQLQGPEQQNIQSKIDAVEAKRDAAKEQLDEIRKAEPDKWNDMQGPTDKTFSDLKQAISDAQSNEAQPSQPQTPGATQIDTSPTNEAAQPQADQS
jgi:hypothetical protein